MSGGTIIAAGSSGMAQAPNSASEQNSVKINFESVLPAETVIEIKNSSGESIMSHTTAKETANLVFSSEDLVTGETYTVYTDETEAYSFTIESSVTTLGSAQGGMNGMGRMGGGGQRTR